MFWNPYIVHLLLSISLNSVSKFKTRDLPSLLGYYKKEGKLPDVLSFSLASLISFYEGTEYEGTALKGSRNGEKYLIQDSPEVLEKFQKLYAASYASVAEKAGTIAKSVLSDTSWWGEDLTAVPGLEEKIAGYLETIWTDGMTKAIEKL